MVVRARGTPPGGHEGSERPNGPAGDCTPRVRGGRVSKVMAAREGPANPLLQNVRDCPSKAQQRYGLGARCTSRAHATLSRAHPRTTLQTDAMSDRQAASGQANHRIDCAMAAAPDRIKRVTHGRDIKGSARPAVTSASGSASGGLRLGFRVQSPRSPHGWSVFLAARRRFRRFPQGRRSVLTAFSRTSFVAQTRPGASGVVKTSTRSAVLDSSG